MAEARRVWRHDLGGIDPGRLIFVDETGIDTRMARAHAPGKVPWGAGNG